MRAQDAAAVDSDPRHLALADHYRDAFLAPTKAASPPENARTDRHADRKRAHAVGDRNDGGSVIAGIESFITW